MIIGKSPTHFEAKQSCYHFIFSVFLKQPRVCLAEVLPDFSTATVEILICVTLSDHVYKHSDEAGTEIDEFHNTSKFPIIHMIGAFICRRKKYTITAFIYVDLRIKMTQLILAPALTNGIIDKSDHDQEL